MMLGLTPVKFYMFTHLNFNTISYLGEPGFNSSYLTLCIQDFLLAMKICIDDWTHILQKEIYPFIDYLS